jgi:ribosomal protein S18 acetylase RimI-like enzyme
VLPQAPLLAAIPVVLIGSYNLKSSVQKYIATSKQQGVANLEKHCSRHQDVRRRCWVVEVKGRVQGFIVVEGALSQVKAWLPPHYVTGGKKVAKIEWLVVDRSARRLGVATELVAAAEKFINGFKDPDDKKVQLFDHLRLCVTSKQHDAVRFYRKCGYKTEHSEGGDMYLIKTLAKATRP